MTAQLQSPSASVDDRTVSVVRRVAAVMVFEAATLAVASAIHLFGHVQGRSSGYSSTGAGVAEAVIGAVLVAAAIVMFRASGWGPAPERVRAVERSRSIGLAATGFAIIGFIFGLTITASSGHLPDIAYHVTMLPVLIGSEVVLARRGLGPS